LRGEGGENIFIEETIRLKALKSIERMIEIL